MKKSKTKYHERSDKEKLEAQWTKTIGLYSRGDWSASIVRAATATEIAANIAIREQYRVLGLSDKDTVDGLLKWANGLIGKLNGLLIPGLKDTKLKQEIRSSMKKIESLNTQRNAIVHMGEFCNQTEAEEKISIAGEFIYAILAKFLPDFKIDTKIKKSKPKNTSA